mmetsp:Transcript_9419/g.9391  ORF Transcript_9419/g.9391 Transcript_9419/m.9391 type:complete len:147 (-) Transcript_9419:27-467(-)|eukprot:CAMPEP_0202943594 /NCGR_PEP_ID=MMETSP1395-20130829/4095_1 /ASSEMBLY_ACC=CAM_ASM_000871 /TAXON_ID=5961 /ORGANISM="Blepharisma japonicum, Strain Stock R1072" /LENGTH=146 /DNA_ID=CAMNT_0049641269 /DNA_START=10 /DNA_END=450 /DNA_ORIENTATION=-
MKAILLGLCLLSLASASGLVETKLGALGGNIGSNCDPSLTTYSVTTFLVTPWPPTKNVYLNLNMTGTVNQALTFQEMDIFVTFNGVNFYQETVKESGTYKAGQTATVIFKVFLPGIAPNGKYGVITKIKDTAGAYLNCWQVAFSLS